MKKWILCLLVLVALCLGACAKGDSAQPQPGQDIPDIDLDDYGSLTETYLFPFINGAVFISQFDGYIDEYAYGLVDFYALNHPEELGDERVEMTRHFDAEKVDEYLSRYFLFEDLACMREGNNEYDAETDTYILTSSYGSRQECAVIGAAREGDILTLEYKTYWPGGEDDWSLVFEGILTVELYEGGFRYIKLERRNHEYPITQDLGYLEEISQKYLMKGSILHVPWENAEETLYRSYMIQFVEENDLLNRHTDEFLEQYGLEEGREPEPPIPPEVLEPLVQQYFEVSSQALRWTEYYQYTDDQVGDLYQGAYWLPVREESPWWNHALHVEEDGDLLYITVGDYGPGDTVSRPFSISDVTVRVEDDGFTYLSCYVDW